jgi:hypothetical protein
MALLEEHRDKVPFVETRVGAIHDVLKMELQGI